MSNVPEIPSSEAVQSAVEQVMAAREGKQVAVRFTPDGEAPVIVKDGKEQTFLPAFEELRPLPMSFKEADHNALGILYGCIHKIREMKRRHVPLTRGEFLKQEGMTKKALRRLETFGLVEERIVRLLNQDGKLFRSSACVYPTPQGRAYILARIDPDYEKEVTLGAQPDARPEADSNPASDAEVPGPEGGEVAGADSPAVQ